MALDTFTLSSILNFTLLGAVLYKAGNKPMKAYFVDRRKNIETSMEEAEKVFGSAEAELNKWESSWESAGEHTRQMMTDAENQIRMQRDEVLKSARKQSERIEQDAKLLGANEVGRSRSQVQKNIVEKSISVAAHFLGKSLGEGERKKFVADTLTRVSVGGTK